MIVVTGGAGFIGSVLLWRLNQEGYNNLIVVDDIGESQKWKNINKRNTYLSLHKDDFFSWLKSDSNEEKIEAIFHMGACSSTAEKDMDYLLRNNVHYSIELFKYCRNKNIPFIYASSAATYGDGQQGYSDDPSLLETLKPINPYGLSKHMFDLWVRKQKKFPPFWAGLKFFNVFGPCEYHKEDMRSPVCKGVPQIQQSGSLGLFKSYKEGVAHGEQKRDFVYVKDVVDVMFHLWTESKQHSGCAESGIYNVGSGKAQSFADLGKAMFAALKIPTKINWIEMPEAIKDGYQYFTEANLTLLREKAGYKKEFTSMEIAVEDYICNYLLAKDPYL